MPIFGLPFIAVGLWMLWTPIRAMRQAGQTLYALTDRRIVRLVSGRKRELHSVLLNQIGPINRSELPDGTGHLRTGRQVGRIGKSVQLERRRHVHAPATGRTESVHRLGKLAQALTRSRKEAGLSPTVGQPAFNAKQGATLEQMLDAYTINGARAVRQDKLIGSIEPGKSADFIVLDRNLFDLVKQGKPEKIADTQVLRPMPRDVPAVHVDALWHRQHQSSSAHRWLREQLLAQSASPAQARLLELLPATPAPQTSASTTEALSVRELSVLKLIALGCSNQQISEQLFISLHTVKTHASHINSKLGVERRTQAVARAKALGLL